MALPTPGCLINASLSNGCNTIFICSAETRLESPSWVNRHKGQAPFAQAVLQSPGFFPVVSDVQQELVFTGYLSLLNVSTIEEARKLPYSVLQAANLKQVGSSVYGQYTYGPAVDGDFVPALPGELLLHGQYSKDLKVMVGHNYDEVSGESRLEPHFNILMSRRVFSSLRPSVRMTPRSPNNLQR